MMMFEGSLVLEELEICEDVMSLDRKEKELFFKIICIGGFIGGVGIKGVLIDDYFYVWFFVMIYWVFLIGVKFYLKLIKWWRSEEDDFILIKL